MIVIIHRINKIKELKKIPKKYGVEIDIRSSNKKLILSHDPHKKGDDFKKYLIFAFLISLITWLSIPASLTFATSNE